MKPSFLLGMSFALCGPAAAHDLWLAAQPSGASVGDSVRVGLRLGEAGVAEAIELRPERTERLWLAWPGGSSEVPLVRPVPSLELQMQVAGTTTLGFISQPSDNALPPAEFDAYLEEEHLGSILEQRRVADKGTSASAAAPIRERYSRSLKLLLKVGADPLRDCAVRLPLEITLMEADAARLVIEATFEGKPLEGLWVDSGDADGRALEGQRTDREGRASFTRRDGEWVLRATHMRAAESGEDAFEWRSWWASTSFQLDKAGIGACTETAGAR